MGVKMPQTERHDCRHHHPFGRLPHGLQLLHDLGVLRRQGQVPQFLRHRRGTVPTDGRGGSARCSVQSFFIMDENFLLHKQRAMELLDRMKATGKSLGAVRLLVGQRHPQVHHARTGGAGRLLDLDGPGIAALRLRQAGGHRHAASSPPNCASTASSCSAPPSSGWSTTRRRTSRDEIEHAIAHDTDFHQFMLYTPVPGTPLYCEMQSRAGCWKAWTWPTSTGRTSSTSSTPPSRATIPSVPGLGFPARFRAQRPQPLPHLPHHAGRLEALQERSRRARPRALHREARALRDGYAAALWAMERTCAAPTPR